MRRFQCHRALHLAFFQPDKEAMRAAPERCAIKSRANSHQYEISIAPSPRRRRASANSAEGHDQDTPRMLFLQEKLQAENSSFVGAVALPSL